MSSCLALEQPLTVAYLGPPGTYTQAAARKHFGQSAIQETHKSITAVFRQVEERRCDFGIVPVENSTEGMVGQTLDCFLESSVKIVGEVELPVIHHLFVGDKTGFPVSPDIPKRWLNVAVGSTPTCQVLRGKRPRVMVRRPGEPVRRRALRRSLESWQRKCIRLFADIPRFRITPATPPVSWCSAMSLFRPVAWTRPPCLSLAGIDPVPC